MLNITLVTGGTGFIGSHLVEELIARKRKVRCLVRKTSNISHLKKLGVELVFGDLADKDFLKKAVGGVETIYHLAAIARPMSIPNRLYFEVNVQGTRNLLEACFGKNLKKIIYMSSISVVGPSRDGRPVNENTPPNPIDVYGKSKLAAEKIVFDFIKKHNLPILILRAPMVFGPRDFELVRFFKAIKTRFFPIKGSGQGGFEFCYVRNLVQASLLAEKKGEIGEIYHISNPRPYTIDEVKQVIAKALGVKLLNISFPYWFLKTGGWVIEVWGKLFHFHPPFSKNTVVWMTTNFWVCDISKAKQKLGYQPQYSLEEGITETVKWYQENNFL